MTVYCKVSHDEKLILELFTTAPRGPATLQVFTQESMILSVNKSLYGLFYDKQSSRSIQETLGALPRMLRPGSSNRCLIRQAAEEFHPGWDRLLARLGGPVNHQAIL